MRAVNWVGRRKMRTVAVRAGALALLTSLLVGYQNCTQVQFAAISDLPAVALGPVAKPEVGACGFEGTTAYDPTVFDSAHQAPDKYVSDFSRYIENILLSSNQLGTNPLPGASVPTIRFSSNTVSPTDAEVFDRQSSFSSPVVQDYWIRRAKILRMRNVIGNLWSSRVENVQELQGQRANNLIRVWAKEMNRVEDLEVFPFDLMTGGDLSGFIGLSNFRMTAIALRADRIRQARDLSPWAGSLTVVARQIDELSNTNSLHTCLGFHSATRIEGVSSPLIRLQGNRNLEGDLAFAQTISGLLARNYNVGAAVGTTIDVALVQNLTRFVQAFLGAEGGVEISDMRINELSNIQAPQTLIRGVEVAYAHDISGDLIVADQSIIHRLERLNGRLILRGSGKVLSTPEGVQVIRQ